ncbi:radical SAM protein [Actinosynnema sp. CA-299493]
MSSITKETGIERIATLYLQLLYQCNFNCAHCFHGENLKRKDRLTAEQASEIMRHFVAEYSTTRVVLLGGEPFLHDGVVAINDEAYRMGLLTEICTNGHAVARRRLPAMVGKLDKLRISLDGLRDAHDRIRKPGSYDDAIETIEFAANLGFKVGVTLTVTSLNVNDLPELTELLADRGVGELKLHQLRLVGNAEQNSHLVVDDMEAVRQSVAACSERLNLLLDDDLLETLEQPPAISCGTEEKADSIARIEMSPDGALTMSCKAVGTNAHAFVWDLETDGGVRYLPTDHDEVLLGIPDVRYVSR